MAEPGFWDRKEQAQKQVEEVSALRAKVGPVMELERQVPTWKRSKLLADEETDPAQRAAAYADYAAEAERTRQQLEDFELLQLLGGENDKSNAFLTVHSGAGGTESCDWAEMLLRMYERWGEHHGFKREVVDIQEGDEAGIKSATIKVGATSPSATWRRSAASTGWCGFRPSTRTSAATRASPAWTWCRNCPTTRPSTSTSAT